MEDNLTAEQRELLKEVAVDPAFIAILAKNIKFFLEHGHDTDPQQAKS